MCHKLIPYIKFYQHWFSVSIRHLKHMLNSFPSSSFAYHKWPLSTLVTRQHFLSLQQTSLLTGSPPVSGSCASSQLNLFCSGPSCPRRYMIKTWLSRGFQHMFNFSTWLKSLIYMWSVTFNIGLIMLNLST